jgi:carbon storage regulator
VLVITQRLGDSLYIGEQIEVCVLRIGARSVRLGIEAPKAIPVVRGNAINKQPRDGGEARGQA